MYLTIKPEDVSKYPNYKLCYIDSIPRTYYDYTPEARAYRETDEWKEQDRLREEKLHKKGSMSWNDPDFGYDYNPILRKGSECQDYPEPDFIPGKQELYAYFTPLDLKEQWGDDWDDSPYEHNAGSPYDDVIDETKDSENYPGVKYVVKSHDITIIRVPFIIKSYNARLPRDWNYDNSPFNVRDINNGAVAWIYDFSYDKAVSIYAGVSPEEFIAKIDEIAKNNPKWEYYEDE